MEPGHGSTPRPLGRAPGRVCEAEHRRQRGARPVAVGEGREPHTCWGEGQKGLMGVWVAQPGWLQDNEVALVLED